MPLVAASDLRFRRWVLPNLPANTDRPRRITILGSTGSIGVSTLDVIAHHPDRLTVHGLSGHGQVEKLAEQTRRFQPEIVVLSDRNAAQRWHAVGASAGRVVIGAEGLAELASHPDTDVVVAAIVGSAGLAGAWAAVQAGKTLALANKETLVVAGPLVMRAARESGSDVLPVDSEHSAIFQALAAGRRSDVRRIVLTASGGPFRGRTRDELRDVTADDALRHPTWRMGPKITVDSATMMNKALEVIEARWLFDLQPDQIEVIIHPESVVHSFVEFVDGSVLAQLSPPDMRLPIQYALTYPDRWPCPAPKLSWSELSALTFEQPDIETFPALQLGYDVAARGGTCGAVLNAANEAAVSHFLSGDLAFLDVAKVCRTVLENHDFSANPTLADLARLDSWARTEVNRWLGARPAGAAAIA